MSFGFPEWYDFAPLSPYWRETVGNAKRHVGRSAGSVISELTFGFWVELLNKANHNVLWMGKQLSAAFPNTTLRREDIHQRLKSIQRLRNRISHHEPILTSRRTLYTGDGYLALAEVLEPVSWVCDHTAHWLETRFRYADAERMLDAVRHAGIRL